MAPKNPEQQQVRPVEASSSARLDALLKDKAGNGGNYQEKFDSKKEWNDQVRQYLKRRLSDICDNDEVGELFINNGIDTKVITEIMSDRDYEDFMDEIEDGSHIEFRPESLKLVIREDDNDIIGKFELSGVLRPFLEQFIDNVRMRKKGGTMGSSLNQRCEIAPTLNVPNDPGSFGNGKAVPEGAKAPDQTVAGDGKTPAAVNPENGVASTDASATPRGDASQGNAAESAARAPSSGNEVPPIFEESEDLLKLFSLFKEKRENDLASVRGDSLRRAESTNSKLDPVLYKLAMNDDANKWEAGWRNFQNSEEIERLLYDDRDERTGYLCNPFKAGPAWTTDNLRELIRDKGDDGKLTFEEIAEALYTERFKTFGRILKDKGVGKATVDQLVGGWTDVDCPIKDNDLLRSFKNVDTIMANIRDAKSKDEIKDPKYRKYFEHKDEIAKAQHILGDYVSSVNTLVGCLQGTQVNIGGEAREMTMYKDPSPVAESLRNVFLNRDGKKDGDPRLYDDEWNEIFGIGDDPRKVTFRDLNGNTAFVDTTWFNTHQSPDTAYKLAYEAAETPLNEKGEKKPLDATSAEIYMNHCLALGIPALNVIGKTGALHDMVDALTKAGAKDPETGNTIQFQNNSKLDAQALLRTLTVHDISQVGPNDPEKAKNKARRTLMRIGSVLLDKQQEEERRETIVKNRAALVKMPEAQVDQIIEDLRKGNKFDEKELKTIKSKMLFGVMLAFQPGSGPILDGLGIYTTIDLGKGVSLTLGIGEYQWKSMGVGASIGKKFKIAQGLKGQIDFGGGATTNLNFGLSLGGKVTKDLGEADVFIEAGVNAGIGANGVGPGFKVGVGLDWSKYPERTEKAINEKNVKEGIIKLDAMTSDARFKEVSDHPDQYPGLGDVMFKIKATQPTASPEAQSRSFNDLYVMFKERIRSNAVEKVVDEFRVTGISAGVMTVLGAPIPYLAVDVKLWSRKLMYVKATPERQVANYNNEQIKQALAARLKEMECEQKELTATPVIFESNNKLIYVPTPEGGQYALAGVPQQIDFAKLFGNKDGDNFERFQAELAKNADISVQQTPDGLLSLIPYKAHGEIEVYVDPKIGDGVHLIPDGAALKLSAPLNKSLYIVRSDITYPQKNRGEVEKTVIVLSDRTDFDMTAVTGLSNQKLYRLPEKTWAVRDVNTQLGKREGQNDRAITSKEDYEANLKGHEGERLRQIDDSEYQNRRTKSHEALVKELGAVDISTLSINPKVHQFAEDFKKGIAQEHWHASRTGEAPDPAKYPWSAKAHEIKIHLIETTEDPEVGQTAVCKSINKWCEEAGLGRIPNPNEFAFIIREMSDATYVQIMGLKTEKAREKKKLDMVKNFHIPVFMKKLEKSTDPTFSKKERDELSKVILDLYTNVKPGSKPEAMSDGTILSMDIGTFGVKGEATYMFQNLSDTGTRTEGMLGRVELKVTDAGVKGKLAQYIIKQHSRYESGLGEKLAASVNEKTDATVELKMDLVKQLRRPLGLHALGILAVMMTDVEMNQMTALLANPREYQLNASDKDTNTNTDTSRVETVKKVFGLLDKIRAAEIAGTPEVDLGDGWKLTVETATSMGAYSVCTNLIKALETEHFSIRNEIKKIAYVPYGAAKAEGSSFVEGTDTTYRIFTLPVGVALPIIAAKETPRKIENPPETDISQNPPSTQPGNPPGQVILGREVVLNPDAVAGVKEHGGVNFDHTGSADAGVDTTSDGI